MSEELLTPRDVQTVLKCGRTATFHLIASGQIPSIKVSRKIIRILKSDLDNFVESRRRAGKQEIGEEDEE